MTSRRFIVRANGQALTYVCNQGAPIVTEISSRPDAVFARVFAISSRRTALQFPVVAQLSKNCGEGDDDHSDNTQTKSDSE